MHLSYLIGGLLFLVALRIVQTLYRLVSSPLKDIPGPTAARFTRLWYFFTVRGGQAHHKNIALHRHYAPPGKFYADIVRLGPDLYSIARPDPTVYGIGSKMPKSDWYQAFTHPDPERWAMFSDPNMARHAETRRKFQGIYSLTSLVNYEQYVDQCADIFQQRLTEAARKGRYMDIAHWFQCYAFDVIGDVTYSKRFGFLDQGQDIRGTLAALGRALTHSALVGIYAWAHPIVYKIMENFPSNGAAGRNYLMKFAQESIEVRRAQRQGGDDEKLRIVERGDDEHGPRDFLDKILDMEEEGTKNVTPYHVFMMCISNIFAGSDTTAVSLSSILYHLIKYPSTMRKLRDELEKCERDGRCEKDRVSFKDSQAMPYLQACIKEGLRLHPATGLPLWRVVPQGGAEICGRTFPEGSVVGINAWVTHYDRDVWGADADQFRPERWLEAEGEKEDGSGNSRLKTMEAHYIVFGLGSRTCIGRHISYLEMSKLIPQIVRKFDFELEKPLQSWHTQNNWFVKPKDFNVKVKIRQA